MCIVYSCRWYIVCEKAKKVNERMQVDISAVLVGQMDL